MSGEARFYRALVSRCAGFLTLSLAGASGMEEKI